MQLPEAPLSAQPPGARSFSAKSSFTQQRSCRWAARCAIAAAHQDKAQRDAGSLPPPHPHISSLRARPRRKVPRERQPALPEPCAALTAVSGPARETHRRPARSTALGAPPAAEAASPCSAEPRPPHTVGPNPSCHRPSLQSVNPPQSRPREVPVRAANLQIPGPAVAAPQHLATAASPARGAARAPAIH